MVGVSHSLVFCCRVTIRVCLNVSNPRSNDAALGKNPKVSAIDKIPHIVPYGVKFTLFPYPSFDYILLGML